jgi:hypothetical protein
MPTVSRDGPGLLVDGLHDGPHGVYEAPITALWRLFAGLDVFPVELVEVRA